MVGRESLIFDFTHSARSILPEGAVIAPKPDHPLLFSGPDVLVGSRGSLLAAFFAKSSEAARPKELFARLVASRLALPGHTTCVVVLTGAEKKHNVFEQLDFAFERAIRPQEIIQVLADVPRSRDRRSYLSEVREDAYVNYAALLHVHRLQSVREDERKVTRYDYDLPLKIGSAWHESKSIRKYDGSLIGLKRTNTKNMLVSAIREYSIQSFNENYDLHQGIPEPKRKTLDVATYLSLPGNGLDPEKPIRVAAFSGWLLADIEDVLRGPDRFIDETQRILERTRSRIFGIQRRKSAR